MKNTVKVSAVQMDVKGLDAPANLAHMVEIIDRTVSQEQAELIIFPELSNSGYVKWGDIEFAKRFVRSAEKIPCAFTDVLGERAAKHGIYIVAGMLEAHPRIPFSVYNSVVLFGPDGKIIGVHHKMHLPTEERPYFYPGNTADVFATDLGNIAVQVCADGSFPELARVFTLKGAEIICTVYNIPRRDDKPHRKERLHHIAACRCIENLNFYIGCNRVGSDASGFFNGHSCIAGPGGLTLALSNSDQEEVLSATLEAEMLLQARVTYSYFRDRKPEQYHLLVEPF